MHMGMQKNENSVQKTHLPEHRAAPESLLSGNLWQPLCLLSWGQRWSETAGCLGLWQGPEWGDGQQCEGLWVCHEGQAWAVVCPEFP